MPLYDIQCTECFTYFEDMFFRLAEAVICPDCGSFAQVLIRPVATVGPMPSKPLKVESIGRTFTSAKEVRDYEKANPDARIVSADSQWWRSYRDSAQEKCERRAKIRGFRDFDDQKAHTRKENVLKQKLEG